MFTDHLTPNTHRKILPKLSLKPVHSVGAQAINKASPSLLSWDNICNCPHEMPICCPSASVDHLHEFWGPPLLHCPCGFHLRECWTKLEGGFLRVWLSQPHFLPFHLMVRKVLSCSSPNFFGMLPKDALVQNTSLCDFLQMQTLLPFSSTIANINIDVYLTLDIVTPYTFHDKRPQHAFLVTQASYH